MAEPDTVLRAGPSDLARRLIAAWAVAGGVVLLAVVLMSVVSVIGAAAFNTPFPGDFELVQMGVAVAAFAFLPYCQLTGANVTADIFTARAPDGLIALFRLIASVIALGFALLLFWRMWAGMFDYIRYRETTTILQIPHWIAFVPILISLALLAIAAILSIGEATRQIRALRR